MNKHLTLHLVVSDNKWSFPEEFNLFSLEDITFQRQNFQIYFDFYSLLAHLIIWWHLRINILAPNFISLNLDILVDSWRQLIIVDLGIFYLILALEKAILTFVRLVWSYNWFLLPSTEVDGRLCASPRNLNIPFQFGQTMTLYVTFKPDLF